MHEAPAYYNVSLPPIPSALKDGETLSARNSLQLEVTGGRRMNSSGGLFATQQYSMSNNTGAKKASQMDLGDPFQMNVFTPDKYTKKS